MKKDKNLTKKDIEDWEEFTNSNQKIFDKERNISPQFSKIDFLLICMVRHLTKQTKL